MTAAAELPAGTIVTEARHHDQDAGPLELGLAELLARLACQHAHGLKRPRLGGPCRTHAGHGERWAFILAGHVDELLAVVGPALRAEAPEAWASAVQRAASATLRGGRRRGPGRGRAPRRVGAGVV